MKDVITVISLGKPYEFTPEGQSNQLSGCTMYYLMTSDISTPVENDGILGVVPSKESMPIDFYNRAKATGLPCQAEVEFGMKNSGGKTVLYIKGLDFIKQPFKAATK